MYKKSKKKTLPNAKIFFLFVFEYQKKIEVLLQFLVHMWSTYLNSLNLEKQI